MGYQHHPLANKHACIQVLLLVGRIMRKLINILCLHLTKQEIVIAQTPLSLFSAIVVVIFLSVLSFVIFEAHKSADVILLLLEDLTVTQQRKSVVTGSRK